MFPKGALPKSLDAIRSTSMRENADERRVSDALVSARAPMQSPTVDVHICRKVVSAPGREVENVR